MSGLSAPKGMGGDSGRKVNETWVSVGDNGFTVSCDRDTPGAVQVFRWKDGKQTDEPAVDNDGKHKFRTEHEELEGTITGLSDREAQLYEGAKTKLLCIHLRTSDGKRFRVDLPEFKRYWESFAQKLPNWDEAKDVRLVPYNFNDKKTGKPRIGITVWQGDVKLANVETPADKQPTDMEDPTTGNMKLSFLARNKWLRDVIIPEAKARLEKLHGETPEPVAADSVRDVPGSGIGDEEEAF